MPIFMDRHDVQGVTAEEVAEVHQEDLKIQEKFNCRALTYWFDEERGTAFCLIEAPDRESVKKMHNEAHGLLPHQIIEVDGSLVETFLGRIEDPEPTGSTMHSDFPVFEDPAFRAIMATELKDAAVLFSNSETTNGSGVLQSYNKVIRKTCRQYGGREVESTYNGFVVSFESVSESVNCAFKLQQSLDEYNREIPGIDIQTGIGLNAGDPVTENNEFFGAAVQLSRRLCFIAEGGQIKISSNVKEQYRKEMPQVLPEEDNLKSLNAPEEHFLNRLMDTTEKIWNQKGFKVKDFCRQIGVSRSKLYREMTGLTGRSPTEFIKEFRLRKAVSLIEKKPDNITAVALETGFSNPSYFAKCFKNRYGLLPSEYSGRIT